MRVFLFAAILCLFSAEAYGQRVYKVNHQSQADIKIHFVDSRSEADVVLFFSRYMSDAVRDACNGVWYETPYASQADFTYTVTSYRSQADLLIYPTRQRTQATVTQSACATIHAIYSRR